MPGTFWVTCASLKAEGSLPPEVESIEAVSGPAPSWLTWWNIMVTTPFSSTVGISPVPAAFATPFSVVPLAVFVPVEVEPDDPPPVLPPRRPDKPLARFLLVFDLLPVDLVVVVEAESPVPINVEIALSISTGPPPLVRPSAEAFPVPSSAVRMMDVSFSEPHAGVAQSRGVPSATDRPGMVTPLAPVMEVMTPWAVTIDNKAARGSEYFMLDINVVDQRR